MLDFLIFKVISLLLYLFFLENISPFDKFFHENLLIFEIAIFLKGLMYCHNDDKVPLLRRDFDFKIDE